MKICSTVQLYFYHAFEKSRAVLCKITAFALQFFLKIQNVLCPCVTQTRVDRKIIVPDPSAKTEKVSQIRPFSNTEQSAETQTPPVVSTPHTQAEPNLVLQKLKVVGHGMQNAGNTCYMASVLHALVEVEAISKKIWQENEFRPKGPTAQSQTRELLTYFHENGWGQEKELFAERDALCFLEEYILEKLAISYDVRTFRADSIHRGMSVQEFLSPKFKLAKPVDLLAVGVGGRAEVAPKNTTPLLPAKVLHVPHKDPNLPPITYSLKAVIVYEGQKLQNGHYYTIVYKDGMWIEYNDANVIYHSEYETVQEVVEGHSSIFIYANPEQHHLNS